MAGRPNAILHDHRVNEIAARETSPCSDGVELASLYNIKWIERVNRVHEAVATVTGYRIHVAALQ